MEKLVGDPVQVTREKGGILGMSSDARNYYEGMLGEIIEIDKERCLIKVRFDDGCMLWFKESEVDHV